MKREYGIARCGLACCLCSENERCGGCNSQDCPDKGWCENRRCSIEKGLAGCYECEQEDCRKGLLAKPKALGFTRYIRENGVDALLSRLESDERRGVVYHRQGITGDYDDFPDADALLRFLKADGHA